ncbi:MAG: hypothetical protein LBL18_01230 [Bacteroidales bacterium]|nr:hypothetical protein [Bacteroidales bacterium]
MNATGDGCVPNHSFVSVALFGSTCLDKEFCIGIQYITVYSKNDLQLLAVFDYKNTKIITGMS